MKCEKIHRILFSVLFSSLFSCGSPDSSHPTQGSGGVGVSVNDQVNKDVPNKDQVTQNNSPTEVKKGFSSWCKNLSALNERQAIAVRLLLEKAETTNCDAAEQKLNTIETLSFSEKDLDFEVFGTLNALVDLSFESLSYDEWTGLEGRNLEKLTKIKSLSITYCPRNLQPIAALTLLTKLTLHSVSINVVSPLSALVNLESLTIKGPDPMAEFPDWKGSVKDLAPLSQLNKLKYLDLRYNKIQDFSPVKSLPKLEELLTQGNP